MKSNYIIPHEVQDILQTLAAAGFDAYIVGGCVRDMLLDIEPKDWDVTTNALPDQIQKLFPESVYENNFGTVGIKTGSDNEQVKIVEVTTYRTESDYTDKRHPANVIFAQTLEEDLSRRDFTVNAMAAVIQSSKFKIQNIEIVDPFGGQEDLKKKIIRTVGDPHERFGEDALRLLRAVRFACQLDFEIEEKTAEAIRDTSALLKHISAERIRDEFSKIIMTPRAGWGLELLREYGLLHYIMPELLEGVGCGQNKHHIYTVWEHNKRALEYTVSKNYSFIVRLASLLHDVGKPRTKSGEGENSTFYRHEIVGANMTRKVLERLVFPKQVVTDVTHLVRNHLFYYNVGEVSEAGVRRFLARVGLEYIDDLLKVREADRIGSGVPKAFPYKLRHLLFMIDKVRRDPISPKMLALNGTELMALLAISPSPRVGWILNMLLDEVMDDPARNTKEYLQKRAGELHLCSDEELIRANKKVQEHKEGYEEEAEKEIKKKHHV